MSQIPSNGALIFNETMDKLLFLVYSNFHDKIVRKLDFPKGKVDEDETEKECAIREIYEETGLRLEKYIDSKQVVKLETIKSKKVNLFFVKGNEK